MLLVQVRHQATQANNNSENGTPETNNKQKNQGGSGNKKSSSNSKSSSNNKTKNNIEPQKIGLIKDSIDNMEDSIDNYIKECFASNTQITQQKLIEKIVACNKEILYTISRGSKAFREKFGVTPGEYRQKNKIFLQ